MKSINVIYHGRPGQWPDQMVTRWPQGIVSRLPDHAGLPGRPRPALSSCATLRLFWSFRVRTSRATSHVCPKLSPRCCGNQAFPVRGSRGHKVTECACVPTRPVRLEGSPGPTERVLPGCGRVPPRTFLAVVQVPFGGRAGALAPASDLLDHISCYAHPRRLSARFASAVLYA